MNTSTRQQGAALLIALIMLVVLAVLAVSGMRGVTLESKITGNRVFSERAKHMADAALREGEFRFSIAQEHRSEMLEAGHMATNCKKSNKLSIYGNNKPCLLNDLFEGEPETVLAAFFAQPMTWLKDNYNGNNTGANSTAAADSAVVAWMPYRGLDPTSARYFDGDLNAYWHLYRINDPGANPESGCAIRGCGTYYYLVNGQAADEVAVQSIASMTFIQ